MSRKAKGAHRVKKNKSGARPEAKGPDAKRSDAAPVPIPNAAPADASPDLEPIAADPIGWVWFIGAIFVVAGVGWYFRLDVNRVFDVPKALVLKAGGCTLFAAWLVYALFGPGVRWRSARIFAAPVIALTAAIIISTMLSVDFSTSFNGVYERQFGLQGYLACVGLFFLVSTGISGKRGAWAAIGVLTLVAGTIGIYAGFQAYGMDPFPFFWNRPHNKVYSYLGNATFAGNALALVMPIATVAAGVAGAVTLGARDRRSALPVHALAWLAGFAGVLAVQILPGYFEGARALALDPPPQLPPIPYPTIFGVGLVLGGAVLIGAALLGSWGPKSIQLDSPSAARVMDAIGAGAMAAMVVGIAIGIVFTRTRGAWVGTGAAFVVAAVLLPELASGTKALWTIRGAVWGTMGVTVLAMAFYVVSPASVCGAKSKTWHEDSACWVYAETIRSIPAAFDPNRTDYGKGQGTRRYLWTESPRVLTNHSATLKRYYDDRADYATYVSQDVVKDLQLAALDAPSEGRRSLDTAWRSVAVWFFGIGIETYRYAFMSHKSKRLEALDPMTNHDNPHNNYLYVLASFGLLGLAAYLWLLGSLLYRAAWRFISPAQALVKKTAAGHSPGLVDAWALSEAAREPQGRMQLETEYPELVAEAVRHARTDWDVSTSDDAVVLRAFDAESVLDDLAGIKCSPGGSRVDRAMALGVIASFFSYSLYSIAGFDSVACSVFLFFLLGAAAVLFSPNVGEVPDNLLLKIQQQWASFRQQDPQRLPALPGWSSGVIALILVPLLVISAYRATVVFRAERALADTDAPRPTSRRQYYDRKVEAARSAVRLNPIESFYKQSLGNALSDAARNLEAEARAGGGGRAATIKLAQEYRTRAEQVLYSALDHAWAPENIYISLFQLYYQKRDLRGAEAALERALVHSPHLGAVRANLASLQLERKALDEADANAQWVLEVDKNSAMAWRVRGRVRQLKGDLKNAARFYKEALKRSSNRDQVSRRFLAEVEKQMTSTVTGAR